MGYQRNLLANLSTKGKIALAASVVGAIIVAILLFNFASKPSYSTMLTGLDPAQTGKVTKALDAQGIGYEIQNNGTALAVDSTQVPQARIALAQAGLGGSGASTHAGFDLVTKQKLGASTFQQQVAYQQALEGELASTIEQIDGVSSATVHLVIPQDQLFASETQPASANVLVTGGNLDGSAVRGIAQLVTSSVKGLKLSSVSITDGSGQLLWPNGESGGSGGSGGVAMKQAAQARYDQMLEGQLDTMLATTVGAGKAYAQVNSDLNVDDTSKAALTYAKKGVPIQVKNETEKLTGGGSAGGAAGAGANIPGFAAAGGAAGGTSNYNRKTADTQYVIDKFVTRTKVAPGAINKLDVAVVVDKSVPAASVTALKQAVTNAAGIQTARGDRLSVTTVAFAKQPAPAAAPMINPIEIGKYVLMGLAALVFLFFVTRYLKRREEDVLASSEPTWLREIEAPRPLASFSEPETEPVQLNTEGRTMRRKLESIVDQEPERVAAQVKTWMSEE